MVHHDWSRPFDLEDPQLHHERLPRERMVVIQLSHHVPYFRHSGELPYIIPQDISGFRSQRQQCFGDRQLFTVIMWTKAFPWAQFNLSFPPRVSFLRLLAPMLERSRADPE